jgi:transcription elongation factor GreA
MRVTTSLLTPKGFEKLSAEYTRFRAERETLGDRMRCALAFGGALPENGEYLDVRRELELLDLRLATLAERLAGAEVIEARRDGAVDLGERVTVLDLQTADTSDYGVVGSGEGDPEAGEVSHESPVGAALLGRRVGDVVAVEAPGGERRLEVVEVEG